MSIRLEMMKDNVATPNRRTQLQIIFSWVVLGLMSPYPIVDKVVREK
jgi:hypothetical protein